MECTLINEAFKHHASSSGELSEEIGMSFRPSKLKHVIINKGNILRLLLFRRGGHCFR